GAQRPGQLGLHLLQAEPAVALQRADRGPGEDLERDVGADRVARQREDRHPVAFRRRDRRGGLLVPVAPETSAVRFGPGHRGREDRQPASRAAAASMKLLESQIRPGTTGLPGSASSLPVDSTTTRGRGRTRTDPRPAAAITATCIGRNRVPAVTSTSPALASSPASRTALPYSALARMHTRALPPSVHSTGIPAAAPCR